MIYTEYKPLVYAILYRNCQDSILAEEITQETFFRIISRCSLESSFDLRRFFKSREAMSVQICRLANKLLERELDRKENVLLMETSSVLLEDIPAIDYLPEYEAVYRTELNEMREKVLKLEGPMRDVISLYYYNNMTYKEVAVYLQQGDNWVKHMLRQGKAKLKQMLK